MKDLKIEEVAMRVGVSVQTLNRWYKYKKDNPRDSLAKLIPAYKKVKHPTGFMRVWTEDDVWKLVEFKTKMIYGRCGRMSNYKGKGTKNGKNKSRKNADT